MIDRALQALHHLRTERRIVADQPQLDAFFGERGELAIEVEAHQAREVGDLLAAPLPVLGRESVQRQHLHAIVDRGLHRAADRLGSGLVPGSPRQSAPGRPPAVAVHDDGDVAWHPVLAGDSGCALGGGSGAHLPRISFSLAWASSSISLIVSSVSFCTSCSRRLRSSSLMSCFFSSCFKWSMPSRRTLRAAMRAFSAYWPTSLASSLRRSSVSSGIGRRITCPSTIGLIPSPALRIAFSTGWTFERSHTWTDSIRGSGVETVATWFSGMLDP